MTEPTVCAILLTADRPELARRAVESFRAQTYLPGRRHLAILDTGTRPAFSEDKINANESYLHRPEFAGHTIGDLRNLASGPSHEDSILIHWDDDDYSHPNRIAEQVALLQSSGAEAVGYNEMLFWREARQITHAEIYGGNSREPWDVAEPEAWLFSNPIPNYALGTSLCYWRKTWERRPFAAISQGEDQDWIDGVASGRGPGVKLWSVSSVGAAEGVIPMDYLAMDDPRMIARIHGKNTSVAYDPALMRASQIQGSGWRRVPEWDSYCRGICE